MIIGVDFDGTIVKHEYPKVGRPNPGAVAVLQSCVERGDKIILWTMRDGKELEEAVEYCEARGLTLWGVNENPDQHWSDSPKAYCNMYIDDAALGCPLVRADGERPWVDWIRVVEMLFPDPEKRE